MKSIHKTCFLIVTLTGMSVTHVLTQGTFQNLNFEAAQLVPIPGDPNGAVQFSAAFPGWTGYIGSQQAVTTVPNGVPIGPSQAFIAIMAPPDWVAHQGSYEVGFASENGLSVGIAQTGQVPTEAKSLQFLALYAPTVSLAGQVLSPIRLGNGPGATSLFGVDVSSFAGQTRELRFQPGLGIDYLDAITFSDQGIPEPSTFGLFTLGALLFASRARRP